MISEQFTFPLSREAFEQALRCGHGRALMHVKQYGLEGMLDIFLDTCAHSWAYDAQCEDARAPWLYKIAQAGNAKAAVLATICPKLVPPLEYGDFWDTEQMCGLAKFLAADGSEQARETLYGSLYKYEDFGDVVGVTQILELDGKTGLIYIAETFGQWLLLSDVDLDGRLLEEYDHDHEKGEARHALEQASADSLDIRRYLDHIDAETAEREAQRTEHHATEESFWRRVMRKGAVSGDEVIAAASELEGDGLGFNLRLWGAYCSQEDQQAVFLAMLQESKSIRLKTYLSAFARTGLPEFDQRVLSLVEHDDELVSWRAADALGKTRHPTIREYVIQKIKKGRITGEHIQMLTGSYQPGDHGCVERALHVPKDIEDLHTLMLGLGHLFEVNPDTEAIGCLLFVYEHSPCSICRGRAVETMHGLDIMPNWVQQECLHDCNEDIRAWVRGKRDKE